MSRLLASVVLGSALALAAGGCGSDDAEPLQPYLDQADIAALALQDANEAIGDARDLLAEEPNAPRLGAVASSLESAAALVDESAGHVDAAIEAADDDSAEAGREALAEADRTVRRAVDAALRANEELLDATDRLGVSPAKIVSPETDLALDEASEATNAASTEVAVALAAAG